MHTAKFLVALLLVVSIGMFKLVQAESASRARAAWVQENFTDDSAPEQVTVSGMENRTFVIVIADAGRVEKDYVIDVVLHNDPQLIRELRSRGFTEVAVDKVTAPIR